MKVLGIILLTVISLFTLKVAFAWGGGDHKGDFVEHRLDRMQENLDLTDAQRVAIKQVLETKQTQMKTLRDSTHEQIKSQLNETQAKQFDEKMEKRASRKGRWGKRHGGKFCDEQDKGDNA